MLDRELAVLVEQAELARGADSTPESRAGSPIPMYGATAYAVQIRVRQAVRGTGEGSMTRRYGDSVDVRRRDDVPAEFVWRNRFYVVRAVLDHWIEAAPWWRSRPARSLYESGGSLPPSAPDGDPPGGVLIDDGEREVWRVEARAGRDASPGVFDLVLDWSTGTWTLARTMD